MKVKTILIVDDTEYVGRSTYRVVESLLEKFPKRAEEDVAAHFIHGNGRDVLAFLEEQPRVAAGEILLLTDGHMPVMHGAELIEEMQSRLGDRLTAVLVSATAADFAAFARRLGFALLEKPFVYEQLARYVAAFLDQPVSS